MLKHNVPLAPLVLLEIIGWHIGALIIFVSEIDSSHETAPKKSIDTAIYLMTSQNSGKLHLMNFNDLPSLILFSILSISLLHTFSSLSSLFLESLR